MGVAYNTFAGLLNDGAIAFMKAAIGSDAPKLQIRTKKAVKFDKKLLKAKRKLIDFVNELLPTQSMPMDYLLQ
jgi:hypothetical protein